MNAVVLVHGVGLDGHLWDHVAALLSPTRSVICYDLLGHGDSPPLARGSTVDTFVEQLAAIAPQKVDLVGFSLGALIAQAFALAHPKRVGRLVLVSTVFDRTPAERTAIMARVDEVRAGGYAATVESAIDRWFAPGFQPAEDVENVRTRMNTNDVESYANAYEIFAAADQTLAARTGDLAIPVLAITGADDPRSTPAMSRSLAAAVPHGRAVVLPGVRHLVPIEAPAALAGHILEFLEGPDFDQPTGLRR